MGDSERHLKLCNADRVPTLKNEADMYRAFPSLWCLTLLTALRIAATYNFSVDEGCVAHAEAYRLSRGLCHPALCPAACPAAGSL